MGIRERRYNLPGVRVVQRFGHAATFVGNLKKRSQELIYEGHIAYAEDLAKRIKSKLYQLTPIGTDKYYYNYATGKVTRREKVSGENLRDQWVVQPVIDPRTKGIAIYVYLGSPGSVDPNRMRVLDILRFGARPHRIFPRQKSLLGFWWYYPNRRWKPENPPLSKRLGEGRGWVTLRYVNHPGVTPAYTQGRVRGRFSNVVPKLRYFRFGAEDVAKVARGVEGDFVYIAIARALGVAEFHLTDIHKAIAEALRKEFSSEWLGGVGTGVFVFTSRRL